MIDNGCRIQRGDTHIRPVIRPLAGISSCPPPLGGAPILSKISHNTLVRHAPGRVGLLLVFLLAAASKGLELVERRADAAGLNFLRLDILEVRFQFGLEHLV
jgi:hypothetical protein